MTVCPSYLPALKLLYAVSWSMMERAQPVDGRDIFIADFFAGSPATLSSITIILCG